MTSAITTRPPRNTLGRAWRLVRPLRMPLALALILAAWPLFMALAWLAMHVGFVVLVARHQLSKKAGPAGARSRMPAAPARSTDTLAAAAPATAPGPPGPANAIIRPPGRIPRR